MASNKVATVVLLDVGSSVSNLCEGETFFKKCQWCLQRIIQRKIFSGEKDELAVVLFGCEENSNSLSIISEDDLYNNICEYTPMQMPNWDIYDKVQKLNTTEVTNSNWVECLIVGLDYLKRETKGKRFKDKQVVVLTNFTMDLNYEEEKIKLIADSLNQDDIKLVVIGIDLEEECKDKVLGSQLPGSIGLMFSLVDKVENGVSLSFTEAEDDIIYYEKKRKLSRFTKVNLRIGSKINIPIRWIKVNLEPTRIKWLEKPQVQSNETPSKKYNPAKDTEPKLRFIMETQKVTKFGDSEVVLSYADLEAMKRQTGPQSCTLLGFVKRRRISRKLLVGKDMYLIIPEQAPHSQAMISAFVDALIESDKFALVRRIAVTNGKIKLGVLVPISDENGKALYFLQLPYAEHSMVVPDVVLPQADNNEVLSAIDNLIDKMTIPVKPKDLPMKDPTFQLRCHLLQLSQLKQDKQSQEIPDFINKLYDPYPGLVDSALEYIQKLESLLPVEIDSKLIDDNNVDNTGAENIFQDEDAAALKLFINKGEEDEVSNKEDMDWINAETQEWPEELKEKYKQPMDHNEIHPIILKEYLLKRNKYDSSYVADKLWKDHGNKVNKGLLDEDPTVQEMAATKRKDSLTQDTIPNTEEILDTIQKALEKNKKD